MDPASPRPGTSGVVWLDAGSGPDPPPAGARRETAGLRTDPDAGGTGARRRPVVPVALVAVLVGAVLVGGRGGVDADVRGLVAPREDARLVLDGVPDVAEPEVDSRSAAAARELAGRARRTWEATVAGLPVAPTPQLPASSRTAAVVDAADGRRSGVSWTVTTALGEDAQWSLSAEVADAGPRAPAHPCRPASWGLPGGRVLACDVTEPRAGVRLVRAEAVLSSSPPRAWASSSLEPRPGGAAPRDTPGYQRVVEFRDRTHRVQVRLLRRMEGGTAPPLDLAALNAIATHPGWRPG